MNGKLSYSNEDDKCYGATGMAIGLMVFNGEDMLDSMNLDASPGAIMDMRDMFYFNGNPGLSAKSAWQRIKANYGLTVAMLISNVMCRSMVLDRSSVSAEMRQRIYEVVAEEGRESCGLDDDEISRIFNQEYTVLFRVFNHTGVHGIVHDFADTFKRRRIMSRMDILEALRALSTL